MPAQGFSLYQDVLGKKRNLQTLNPRELGLLATNFKDTDVGLGAERWIQSAPMSYWQQHMKPHPTAIWDAQENLAPLPVTGASLLNPIYDPGGPVAYWLQKQRDTSVQQPVTSARAKVTRQAATQPTSVVQPVTSATEPVPDFNSGMSEVIRLVNLKTPESYQLAEDKYNLLLQFHPNMYHKSFDSYLQASGLQRPTATATSGLAEMSLNELTQRMFNPELGDAVRQEMERRNQIYTPELAAQRPGYFQSQFGTLLAAQPVPSETPAIKRVLQNVTSPVVPAVEAPVPEAPVTLDKLIEDLGGPLDQIDALIAAGDMAQAKDAYTRLLEQNPRLNTIDIGVGEMDAPLYPELETIDLGWGGRGGRPSSGTSTDTAIPVTPFITTGELTATDQRPFGATKIPDQLQAHLDDPSLAGVSSGDPSFDLAKLPPKKAVAEGAIDTSIDYGSYSPEWLQTLVNKGGEEGEIAATYLRTKFPNWTGTDTSSIVDQFPAPEVRDFVADRTASDLLQTGASPTTEIQTEDFYEAPAEVDAVEEVSAIPDINYEAQTNEFLQGLAATDSEAAAVLANRDISPVEEEVVAPVDLTVETPIAPQTNWTQMTDAALSGAAMANNEGAIAEQGERNRLRQSINAWDDERLKRVVEGNYGVILNFGPKDPRYPMLQAYAQEELDKRATAIPEEVIDTTTTLATPEEDIVTTEVDTVPEDTLLGQEGKLQPGEFATTPGKMIVEYGSGESVESRTPPPPHATGYLDKTPLTGTELAVFTQKYDQNPAFSEKMWADLDTLDRDYGTNQLPKAYQVQFDAWVSQGGTGVAPDLAQIMGAPTKTTTGTTEVAAEPVPETEWTPPAPYIPTEPTEAITIDAVAEPVTYDRLDIPTAGGGTLPATSTTELAPYDPAKLPALSQISATIPGQRQVQAATGAEEMENLAKARRDYFEQFEAPAIRAQAEQDRSAVGQLRGQMMARQGLMGSPLGVGLGVQQEAQMRSLSNQEIARQRGAMEMQLAEQKYLADQAAADRALQAGQFGVTAGLQQAGIRLQQQELAGQQALQRAGLDIRQHEFATTTALAKSEQELRKEESDARVELDKLNMEIRQREFGTTTGLEISDQELRRQQINAGLKVQQAEMAVSQKEFAASIGLQISQQELEKLRIDATERLNKSSLALEREQFGAEKGFRETEQDLQRQQFEATRDLGVANQLLQQKAYNADTKYRNDELAWRKAQAVIKEGLEIRQLDLEEERINATRDLEEADQALREQQFGAATAFQVTQADLEERRFQAQERLNKVDRDFRQSELDATMEMDQADQLFQDKQLGVTTGLQRAQLAIQERGLIFETESDRLDREFSERQLKSDIGLKEAQLGLSTQQLEYDKLATLSDQILKEDQLAQQLGLAQDDQKLARDQFRAGLLTEEADRKFQKYAADADSHIAMKNLDLQQQTVTNNKEIQKAEVALRTSLQEFNESQGLLANARSDAELTIRKGQWDQAKNRYLQDIYEFNRLYEQRDRLAALQLAAQDDKEMNEIKQLAATFIGEWAQMERQAHLNKNKLPGEKEAGADAFSDEINTLGGDLSTNIKTEFHGLASDEAEVIKEEFKALDKEIDDLIAKTPEGTDTAQIPRESDTRDPMIGSREGEPWNPLSGSGVGPTQTAELSPINTELGTAETAQPTGGMYPLQSESGSSNKMGVWGTPSAEQVAGLIKQYAAEDMRGMGAAITKMIEGFEEGYRTGSDDEVPSAQMQLMMDELAMMKSGSVEGALTLPQVIAVINRHLGTPPENTVATDPTVIARNKTFELFGQTQQQTNPNLNALKARLGVK